MLIRYVEARRTGARVPDGPGVINSFDTLRKRLMKLTHGLWFHLSMMDRAARTPPEHDLRLTPSLQDATLVRAWETKYWLIS